MSVSLTANAWRFLRERNDAYVAAWNKRRPQRPLRPKATERQMRTAADILDRLKRNGGQFGLLLADDVGTGKTVVAILVAAVFAGKGGKVRVLAPNEVLRRKWKKDAQDHLEALGDFCEHLELNQQHVKDAGTSRLCGGRIQVVTHNWAKRHKESGCDLLIVDEAHRSGGRKCVFRQELRRQKRKFGNVLFLTATPFSIDTCELVDMLKFLGAASEERTQVRKFAQLLAGFWDSDEENQIRRWAQRMGEAYEPTLEVLRRWVIRHSVDNLAKSERRVYGSHEPWGMPEVSADDSCMEILLRADRLFELAKHAGLRERVRTNDPRSHVGWGYLRRELSVIAGKLKDAEATPDTDAMRVHARFLRTALKNETPHPKVEAVADAVAAVVAQREKVLIFCYHHATAVEVARALHRRLADNGESAGNGDARIWQQTWESVLGPTMDQMAQDAARVGGRVKFDVHLEVLASWLSAPYVRAQVERGLPSVSNRAEELCRLLRETSVDGITYASAANDLFRELARPEAASARGLLAAAHREGVGRMLPTGPVMALVRDAESTDRGMSTDGDGVRVVFPGSPDAFMAMFGSPFGPEVLVATDRLSEGVDLHHHCRHVVHYELSPSPVRVMQRNGRVRRLNSWAARTGKPIRVAYPRFGGTRDERLVEIVGQRLDCFELLLGGVGPDIDVSDLDADRLSRLKHDLVKEQLGRRKGDPLAVDG